MTQSDFGNIDASVNNGTQLASMLNNWRNSVHTLHTGAARPSYVQPGMLWINTSGGAINWIVNIYLGPTVGDKSLYAIDTTTGAIKVQGDVSQATNAPQATAAYQLLAASVNIPSSGWANGPSIGPVGANGQVWRLDAGVAFSQYQGSTFDYYTFRFWNGSAQVGPLLTLTSGTGAGFNQGGAMSALVTLTGPTTFTVQVEDSTGNGQLIGGGTYILGQRVS